MALKTATRQLPLPAEAIDIADWLFSLSDDDYQATARAHLGAGSSRSPDGRRAFFDAERFGPIFIVNHHVEEKGRPDYVRVRSPNSRAWFFGLGPLRLGVSWEMAIRESRPHTCELECRLRIEPTPPILDRLASLLAVPIMHRRHLEEQLDGFAADLLRKYRPASRQVHSAPAAG